MVPKQKWPPWGLVAPRKRVLHGFVVIIDLHEPFIHQPKSKRLVFYVWTCLGLQCCFCSAATASDGAKVSLVTAFFAILCWLGNTQDVLANGSKPYPERSQRLFSHAGRVWGVSSGSVTLFVSCEATEWPRLQEDAFQGVWGQPTWLHRWMTVRRWAMCLLGAFCSGRGCTAMVAVDGTSNAY